MKSVNVRKIAAVGAGAAMIAAAFAGAVQTDTTNLASFPFYSNGEPNVKIVVGSTAMPSDAVAAANIAAMIGNLAYTAKEISVLGVEGLGTTGGTSTGGTASASLEVTTPGVNPNVAYQMKTYIGGYLSYNTIDTKSQYSGASSILSTDGTTFGRKVTNYESPQLVNKFTVTDSTSAKTYTEEERYFLYANTAYDNSGKAVKAKNGQIAYEAQFTNPIQYCTDATPSAILTAVACEDQYQTDKHRVKIKLFGSDWVIQTITPGATVAVAPTSIVIGKEVQYKEFMQIGDEATAPNGVKIKLADISGLATSTNMQPPVTFEVYDKDGNKVDTATLQESGTNEYSKNGVVIHLWTAFSGLGGNNYAQVSMYSDKLTLTNGNTVNTDNNQWTVTIVPGGAGYGSSISRLQLTRIVIDDISEGGTVAYINAPQLMKLTFTGLEPVTYDTLSFGTGARNFPVTATDATTLDQSYVRISSSLTSPFQFSDTNTNTVYWVTDANNVGAAGIGTVFYQNTNGYFTPYFGAASALLPSLGQVIVSNATTVTFSQGTNTTPPTVVNITTAGLCGPGTAAATFKVDATLTYAQSTNTMANPLAWNLTTTGAYAVNSSTIWTTASTTEFNASCNVTGYGTWNVTLPVGIKLTSPLPSSATTIRYNVSLNYVPYTYSSRTVYMKFNSTNATAATTLQPPTLAGSEAIAIPEEQFDNDNGTTTSWGFNVYDASTATPKIATASGTTYFYYGGTAYESGYISPRGSKATSMSSTGATLNYATSLAHALYTLAKAGTETTGASSTTDFKIGEDALNDGGYKVVVKGVNAGGGVAGGQISGIENLHPSVATADSVVNLNTASTPLVVLDSQASTTQPLIVVGGPMVNSVASTVLGGRGALTAGTEAMVKVFDDKIVVAGYLADDTMAAANALINWMASNKDNIQGRA